jgi:hypothetical protein
MEEDLVAVNKVPDRWVKPILALVIIEGRERTYWLDDVQGAKEMAVEGALEAKLYAYDYRAEVYRKKEVDGKIDKELVLVVINR